MVGRIKPRGNCGWQINVCPAPRACGCGPGLTGLGLLGLGRAGAAEPSLPPADRGLGAPGSGGPAALELLLRNKLEGALVLSGALPPPRIPPHHLLQELLRGPLGRQVPARAGQPPQGCSHPKGRHRAGGM